MTTWRDIADQLTPTQIRYLEGLEQDPPAGLLAKPAQHLALARGWAIQNLEQCLHADVAPPSDAVEVGPWRKSPAGWRCRSIEPPEIGIAGLDIALRVRGVQYTDGRVEYRLVLSGDGLNDLDPASARDVAAALMSAAER
jgi:hypothetical protein